MPPDVRADNALAADHRFPRVRAALFGGVMKVAIVGCGQIADAHVQEVRQIPGASVVGLCDSNWHMAEQAGARFGIEAVFTDLDALLDKVRPDVVHVTTPPGSHLPISRAAFGRGIHAYIEKPFAPTAAEAEELVESAKRAGVLVCVGHCQAFDDVFLRLRALHAAGTLGEVVHADAVMGYNLRGPFGGLMLGDPGHWVHKLPGGIPHNNISHPLSLVMPFIPDERPEIIAKGLRWRPERYGDLRDRFYDELRVTLIGANSTASIRFSCRARPLQIGVSVSGTLAQAVASLDSKTLELVTGASLPGSLGPVQWARRGLVQRRREFRSMAAGLFQAKPRFFDGMQRLFREFYAAIRGEAPMPIDMNEAVRASRILDGIFAACDGEEAR
jgi:predicted dehydrogenase